jgi:hypothetical protein
MSAYDPLDDLPYYYQPGRQRQDLMEEMDDLMDDLKES